MLEGRYNDILVPNEHYLEIKKDYSNVKEEIEKFRDSSFIEKMATSTLEYVLDLHQHKHRLNKIKELF